MVDSPTNAVLASGGNSVSSGHGVMLILRWLAVGLVWVWGGAVERWVLGVVSGVVLDGLWDVVRRARRVEWARVDIVVAMVGLGVLVDLPRSIGKMGR